MGLSEVLFLEHTGLWIEESLFCKDQSPSILWKFPLSMFAVWTMVVNSINDHFCEFCTCRIHMAIKQFRQAKQVVQGFYRAVGFGLLEQIAWEPRECWAACRVWIVNMPPLNSLCLSLEILTNAWWTMWPPATIVIDNDRYGIQAQRWLE